MSLEEKVKILKEALERTLFLFDAIEDRDGCLSEDEQMYKEDILEALRKVK